MVLYMKVNLIEETEPPFPLFQAFSSSPPVNPNLNILLLAHEGVGKSTFINAFVNYIKYQTFDEALSKKSVVLKPLSFAVTSNNYFETRTVQLGDIKSPKRPGCQTYIFDLQRNNGKKLCLIDTPSFQDSGSVHSTNSANTKHILDYVNNLTHLDAICLLLQPDESRLLNDLQSCFVQLLKRLGTQAYRNVIFCFTNALTTFYSPGKTASSIRNMFISYSLNNIKFDRSNTFFFENESFRYLIAIQNGIKFTHEDEQEYTTSWTESVMESKRLLDYISKQLVSCQIVKK
ncbi:hypothetical protein I4U23_001396 [Adineta vaga]|nr:hypothetical protein I4U23_001396 [Adineta vaga]